MAHQNLHHSTAHCPPAAAGAKSPTDSGIPRGGHPAAEPGEIDVRAESLQLAAADLALVNDDAKSGKVGDQKR